MTYRDLVDLFFAALAGHETEEAAFADVDYLTGEALALGFTVGQITDAYVEAEQG